jgi:hypothetical protein
MGQNKALHVTVSRHYLRDGPQQRHDKERKQCGKRTAGGYCDFNAEGAAAHQEIRKHSEAPDIDGALERGCVPTYTFRKKIR